MDFLEGNCVLEQYITGGDSKVSHLAPLSVHSLCFMIVVEDGIAQLPACSHASMINPSSGTMSQNNFMFP